MKGIILTGFVACFFAGCLTTDTASSEKIVVREVRPAAGVKVIDRSMEVRYYPVPASHVMRLSSATCELKQTTPEAGLGDSAQASSEVVAKESDADSAWKRTLAGFDVLWPEGSSLVYLPNSSKLRVRNTAENHDLIERALEDLNESRPLIEVGFELLSVDQKTLDALGRELVKGRAPARFDLSDFGEMSADALRTRLAGTRDVTIVTAAKVVTQNGENAVFKDVDECVYPQDYDVQMAETSVQGAGEKKETRRTGPAVVEPQNFTMREVGTVLDVTPCLTEGRSFVDLGLRCSYVSGVSWKDFGTKVPLGNGAEYALPMEQPIFPCRWIDTKLRVAPGAYALVGAFRARADKGREGPLGLVFARVRLLDAQTNGMTPPADAK